MKKTLIPTLLTTVAIAPVICLVGCGEEPAPEPIYPADTFEWNFGLNGVFSGRVAPLENLEPQTQDDAMTKYLQAAQQDPRAVVDDLLYADNAYYIQLLSAYSQLDLLQYKTKITVSDFDPVKQRFSIQLQRVIKVLTKGAKSVVSETAADLAIKNMPYYARYKYQNVGSLIVPIWEFLPPYLSYDFEEMKAEMATIDGWAISGSIIQTIDDVETTNYQYDWNTDKADSITQEQYQVLTSAYNGIDASYYFADVPVKGDYELQQDAQPDTYTYELAQFKSEDGYKIFELDANKFSGFKYGQYTMTIKSDSGLGDGMFIDYDKNGQCNTGYISPSGIFSFGTLNTDTIIKFKLRIGSSSYDNFKIEIKKN